MKRLFDLFRKRTVPQLRKGMWVMTPQGVGIVTDFTVNTTVLVDLVVTPDGTTRLTGYEVDIHEVRQATLKEIPAARRPTAEHGRRFGYE